LKRIYRKGRSLLGRYLVFLPSNTLRKQISGKFETLGILPDVGVVPLDRQEG
jgi:hypothetical protein